MSAEKKIRRPADATEREARRLGWHRGCPVTWREFLEQYPYALEAIAEDHWEISSAA